jgi:hypothetical protein
MAKKKKHEITIRSSAAEYLTFVVSTGDSRDSIKMRYEAENIYITLVQFSQIVKTRYGGEYNANYC